MPISLNDAFFYYKGTAEQRKAVELLEKAIGPELLADDQPWVIQYRAEPEKPPTVPGIINPDLMHRLTGYSAASFNEDFCNDFNEMLRATGFDKHVDATQMLVANLMHESCNFLYMKEIDPGYYLEGRSDLQNTQPGDGPRFRGCGPLQVTGRGHATAFYEYLKREKGIDEPNILSIGTDWTADHYAFQIAISWIQNNGLLNVCIEKGFDECCYRINGGWNGFDDRKAKFQICQKEIR